MLTTWSFLAPSLVVYGAFFALPILLGLAYGFTSWNGIGDRVTFSGLANFRSVFADSRFYSGLRHTVTITAAELVVLVVLSLTLARLIEGFRRRRRVSGTLLALFVFPFFLGTVMVTVLWRYILDFRYGFINTILRAAGLGGLAVDWLGNPHIVLLTIVGVDVWSSIGIYVLVFVMALQAVPTSLVETSILDGARPVRRFVAVELPYVLWALNVNIVIMLSKGLSTFETVLLLTQGGPGFSSETISYYIYWMGFLGSRQGYGSALSVILFCATSIISISLWTGTQRRASVALS
jgi:ABC-type sugar transport system permease subunit